MPQNRLAPSPQVTNAMAPTSADDNPYIASLLAKAAQAYPFVLKHKPIVIMGTGDGYAETWPVGETGAADAPRPAGLPIGRVGVEVRRPNDFNHNDLAAEMLHIDPYAREISAKLQKSWTPAQLQRLKATSKDYQMTLDEPGRTEADAIQNATDSAMRGTVMGQWPADRNAGMQYTPEQQTLLQSLMAYTRSAK